MRCAGRCDLAIMAAKLQPVGCDCAVQSAILASCWAVNSKVAPELHQVCAVAVLLLWLSCPIGNMSVPYEPNVHCHVRPQMRCQLQLPHEGALQGDWRALF